MSIQHSKGRYTYFFCLGKKSDLKTPSRSPTSPFDDIFNVSHFECGTRVEVIRGLSNPVHPTQMLVLSWKTREETPRESSNDKIPMREYVLKQSHARLDLKQIEDLIVAYQSGSTIKELTTQFKVHHTTVSNVLERCGVPRRNRPLTPEQIEHAIMAYRAGSSSKMIGDLLDVDGSTISRTLRRAGLEMRDNHGNIP